MLGDPVNRLARCLPGLITTLDLSRMQTSQMNQALLQPSGNNTGQNTAETQCGTIRVPKARVCFACWIVRGTK